MSRSNLYLLALLFPLIAACGGGGGGGSSTPNNGGGGTGGGTTPPAAPELNGVSPSEFTFTVRSGETIQGSLFFSNAGNAALEWSVAAQGDFITFDTAVQGSLAAGSSDQVDITATCSGADETGTLTLTTNDTDEGTTDIPVQVTCEAAVSYALAKVTYNQAARAFDSSVSADPTVPVVAGRELLVRAFVTGDGPSPTARVILSRAGAADAIFNMNTPVSVGADPAGDGDLTGSHYVIIPGTEIFTGSELVVEVGPGGSQARYPETGTLDMQVVDPGVLGVTLVPVTFEGDTPTLTQSYFNQSLQQMPIGEFNIQIRTPYVFTGAFDLDQLLDEISDLRDLDGSGRLYVGIIPAPPSSGGGARTAGIAFVGFPVGVSLDLNGTQNVISHEVGHNLGLRHAPGCDAPNTDPNYPYADGAVVTWGYDIIANDVVRPTASLADLMTYCPNVWVSDYNFAEALDFRVTSPNAPTGTAGIQVRGRVVAGQLQGELSVLPATRLRAERAAPGAESMTFRAWDINGELLVEQAVNLYEIGDRFRHQGFSFTAPVTLAAVHHIEIVSRHGVLHRETLAPRAAYGDTLGQVQWQGERAEVSWQPAPHRALIVRDTNGEVVTVDRTGRISLPEAQGFTLEFTEPGFASQPRLLNRGQEQNFQHLR